MKLYLAIFTGSAAAMDAWKALDPAVRARRERDGLQAWRQWATAHAAAIADLGAPLGRTRRVSAEGVADIRNAMGAWTVVRAESHEQAAAMFREHPHFSIFAGDGVEVMECLPIPGQD